MRQEGHTLIFDYPGGQITFNEDLKKWYEILKKCRKQSDEVIAKLGTHADPEFIMKRTNAKVVDFLQADILPSLAEYGIYNLTPNDFLTDNFAYDELKNLTGNMLNYEQALSQAMEETADASKRQAESDIVTGMGFGVLSSSLASHAIYAMQSKSVLTKQQWEYNRVADKIDTKKWNAIREGKEKNRVSVVEQRDMLIQFCFEVIGVKYYAHLAEVGQIGDNCLEGINEGRSNELLKNLDFVPNKEGVIFQAIQCCPYNLNIYWQMYKIGILFQPIHKEILEYSGALEDFCEVLAQSFDHTAPQVSQVYDNNERAIQTLGFIQGLTPRQVAQKLLIPDFQRIFKLYYEVSVALTNNTLGKFLKDRYNEFPFSEYISCLQKELCSIRDECNTSELSFMSDFCGIDAFQQLSIWFGEKVNSFEDADKLIRTAWSNVQRAAEIEEIEQQIEEYKKQFPNPPDVKKNLSISIVCGLFGLLFLFFWIACLLVDGDFYFVVFIPGVVFSFVAFWLLWDSIKASHQHKEKTNRLRENIEQADRRLKELKEK